jgi:hypothetical protein
LIEAIWPCTSQHPRSVCNVGAVTKDIETDLKTR